MYPVYYKNQFETKYWKKISENECLEVEINSELQSISKIVIECDFLILKQKAKSYEFDDFYNKAALHIIGSNEIYKKVS